MIVLPVLVRLLARPVAAARHHVDATDRADSADSAGGLALRRRRDDLAHRGSNATAADLRDLHVRRRHRRRRPLRHGLPGRHPRRRAPARGLGAAPGRTAARAA